jgi:hypothetical protein
MRGVGVGGVKCLLNAVSSDSKHLHHDTIINAIPYIARLC